MVLHRPQVEIKRRPAGKVVLCIPTCTHIVENLGTSVAKDSLDANSSWNCSIPPYRIVAGVSRRCARDLRKASSPATVRGCYPASTPRLGCLCTLFRGRRHNVDGEHRCCHGILYLCRCCGSAMQIVSLWYRQAELRTKMTAPQPPPPFPSPQFVEAKRSVGAILDDSNAYDPSQPLKRQQSLAGNVLVLPDAAYMLQRKIVNNPDGSSIRIALPMDQHFGLWKVRPDSPKWTVQIQKVEKASSELAVMQFLSESSRTKNPIVLAKDAVFAYALRLYHDGTLHDYRYRLDKQSESQARFFFRQLLQVCCATRRVWTKSHACTDSPRLARRCSLSWSDNNGCYPIEQQESKSQPLEMATCVSYSREWLHTCTSGTPYHGLDRFGAGTLCPRTLHGIRH